MMQSGSPLDMPDQVAPASRDRYTPLPAATQTRSWSSGRSSIALTGSAGSPAERSVQVVPPSVDRNAWLPPTFGVVAQPGCR